MWISENNDFKMDQNVINILGFNGSSLAIYFDLLLCLDYRGDINIIRNDDRISNEEYDVGLSHRIMMIEDVKEELNGKFLICSSNPYAKYVLLNIFGKHFSELENRLLTLVHPASRIGSKAEISDGVIIEPGVIISPFAKLMKGVYIGRGATIGHHNEIAEWATINPGATLAGKVRLGDYVTVGPGVTIVNGISVGDKSIIGAGSVVTKDVPAGVIAYGNPCKVIRENTIWHF